MASRLPRRGAVTTETEAVDAVNSTAGHQRTQARFAIRRGAPEVPRGSSTLPVFSGRDRKGMESPIRSRWSDPRRVASGLRSADVPAPNRSHSGRAPRMILGLHLCRSVETDDAIAYGTIPLERPPTSGKWRQVANAGPVFGIGTRGEDQHSRNVAERIGERSRKAAGERGGKGGSLEAEPRTERRTPSRSRIRRPLLRLVVLREVGLRPC